MPSARRTALQRSAYCRLWSTIQRKQPLGHKLRQRRQRRPREYSLLHRRAQRNGRTFRLVAGRSVALDECAHRTESTRRRVSEHDDGPGQWRPQPLRRSLCAGELPRRRDDQPGDILVSNFNNSANQQGTGTTIVDITPKGGESTFFQGPSTPGQLGLTTALGVLKRGFVIVGSVPATYDSQGNLESVGQGSLMILDRNGNVVTTISDSSVPGRSLGPDGQ